MSEGLFEMKPVILAKGDYVEVKMPWGETWDCEVNHVGYDKGWPQVHVHRRESPAEDDFQVAVARCRKVSS